MDVNIKEMIELAKSAGSITQKQKEVILNKARTVGCDVDEVEMEIETIPTAGESPKIVSKVKKCPHCGALLPSMAVVCTECGYRITSESEESRAIRNSLEQLESKLILIDDSEQPEVSATKKATIINTFTIPNTFEGLVQLLTFSYGNFEVANGSDFSIVSKAWLAKAIRAHELLSLQVKESDEDYKLVQRYSFLCDKEIMSKVKVGTKENFSKLKEVKSLISGQPTKGGPKGINTGTPKTKTGSKGYIWVSIALLIVGAILFLRIRTNNLVQEYSDRQAAEAPIRKEVLELTSAGEYDKARIKLEELTIVTDKEKLYNIILEAEFDSLIKKKEYKKAREVFESIKNKDSYMNKDLVERMTKKLINAEF